MKFKTEQEAIDWVRKNIFIAITPKRASKHKLISPFISNSAHDTVVEGLGRRLFNESNKCE